MRVLTNDEMTFATLNARAFYDSEFVPIDGTSPTQFILRMITCDNDGRAFANGAAKPIIFGPFRTKETAMAVRKQFMGISVSVDTIQGILCLSPEDRIQPCDAEMGYYVKFNVQKPKVSGNVELIRKVIVALLSYDLCTIENIGKLLSVSARVIRKGKANDDDE